MTPRTITGDGGLNGELYPHKVLALFRQNITLLFVIYAQEFGSFISFVWPFPYAFFSSRNSTFLSDDQGKFPHLSPLFAHATKNSQGTTYAVVG